MDITKIIISMMSCFATVLFAAGTVFVASYLKPWLKEKLTKSQLEELLQFLAISIKAAQQMGDLGLFDDLINVSAAKKDYVLRQAKKWCEQHNMTFDEEAVSNLIEGILRDVKDSIPQKEISEEV